MSYNFIQILEELKKTTGTLDKIAILEKNKDNQELRQYLYLAIDERVTYGIKKLPDFKIGDGRFDDIRAFENFKSLLYQLEKRELSGNNALDSIDKTFSYFNQTQQKWFIKCIQKDLSSIGIGASLVNKAFGEKFILDFRCSGAADPKKIDKMKYDADAQLKKNGIRSLFFTDDEGRVCIPPFNTFATCIGRSGLPIEQFNFLIPEINKLKLANRVFDGEVSVEDNLWLTQTLSSFKIRDKSEFIGKNGKLKEKAWKEYKAREDEFYDLQSRAKFTIFEILDKEEFLRENIKLSYIERRTLLEEQFKVIANLTDKIDIVPAVSVKNKEEALAQANKWIEEGFEGAVIKSHEGKYGFTKGDYAIKIKRQLDVDAIVIDCEISKDIYKTNGEKGPDQLGAFIIEYIYPVNNKRIRSKVGTGRLLSKEFKEKVAKNPEEYIGKIYEISAQEFSEDGILICPRVERMRPDKIRIND